MEATPGAGRDGPGLSGPGSPDGLAWDEDAWLRWLIADTEADEAAGRIPGEGVQDAWVSVAGVADPAELDLRGLAQGGLIDVMPPDAPLAALAAGACEPGVLAGLSDNQVLGLAAAGRRLAGRAAWVQQAAVAEFASRRLEPDRKKATPLGFTLFAPDELAPELVITSGSAELQMSQARDASRRLPGCFALLRDGRISEFQLKIITEATGCLSDADAAEADRLLAAAAADLTPGQLRAMCARTVMMIDPRAAQRRKDSAARQARVGRFREYSGNAALCGRELPPDEVLASSQHIDAVARTLRAAGIPGSLRQLRVRVFLDLTQGLDPLERLAGAGAGAGAAADGAAGQADGESGPGPGRPGDRSGEDDRDEDLACEDANWAGDDGGWDGDGGAGPGGRGEPRPGGPSGSGGGARAGEGDARAGKKAPVRAVINLLVPAGTLFGWSAAPGEIAGFGLLDPQATRDMTEAAAAHPQTRWCVTVAGPDGTASAHGCAPGRHPWTPPPARDGPPGPGAAGQAAQVIGLLRRLRVQLAPIAKGHCDHRHHSDRYVISRKLKHLLNARAATCIAPGCNRPAANADADHTIPWPDGPSCECNLGAPCRYHHRNKQAPGWRLEQPEPGVMKWHNPSGRTHITYPTRYII